jgi:hypothetical protein
MERDDDGRFFQVKRYIWGIIPFITTIARFQGKNLVR